MRSGCATCSSSLLANEAARRDIGDAESLADRGKARGRPLPLQLVDVVKERRIGSERCEFLEQQCECAVLAEYFRRKILDFPIPRK